MNVGSREVWQVAAGDTDRNYVDLLLEWDVIAMGPGWRGPWPDCKTALSNDGWSEKKLADLKRFCEDLAEGDLIVLPLRTTDIYGVGEVVGNHPLWLDDFGDIDGWDLQHVRRVKWIWRHSGEPQQFPTHTMRWGDTVNRLRAEPALNWLRNLEYPQRNFLATCELYLYLARTRKQEARLA
ncbi:MAG: hypothetical protein ACREOO_12115 [bacterium]